MDVHRKILCVVGTRPEAIKMAPVMLALRARPWASVRVVTTGQHRELLQGVLEFFGLRPDLALDVLRDGQSLCELTARLLTSLDQPLTQFQPQLVLAQGDTTTVLATALACFYRQIPFAHVEAGLRTGCRKAPFPEEMNRLLASRLADWHFAPTLTAAQALRAEGVPPDRVFVVGNTVVDALRHAALQPLPGLPVEIGNRPLLLVTAHRRENIAKGLPALCSALREIVARRDVQVLLPVHPNPRVRRELHARLAACPQIALCPPLDYPTFVAAMRASHLILTDSGGVQEEAPALGKPVLVLREATERPEGVAAGAARLVGTRTGDIVAAVLELLDDPQRYHAMAQVRYPYGKGDAATMIADLIEQHVLGLPGARSRLAKLPAAT